MTGHDVDVLVVGGGAMGSAAAWQLAGRGVETLLLERFGPGHVRGASHGASRIFRLSYPGPAQVALARDALGLWRDLEAESGVELLTITGGVSHGAGPALPALHEALTAQGVASEFLPPAEAEARWPGLRIDTRALLLPDSGRLHADRSVAALQASAVARGARVRHRTAVARVVVEGPDAVRAELGDGTSLRARRVVVTAGAWAAPLLGGVVPLPPLRVTQEQPAHYAVLAGNEGDWPSFVHLLEDGRHHGGVYGLGTPGEGVKVGFHGVGPEVDPDRRSFVPVAGLAAELDAYVREWLPGVSPSGVPVTCTYTTTPDEVFVLDRFGPVVVGAGFSGQGFKFVPAVGRVLADLTLDDDARPDPVFLASRFAGAGR